MSINTDRPSRTPDTTPRDRAGEWSWFGSLGSGTQWLGTPRIHIQELLTQATVQVNLPYYDSVAHLPKASITVPTSQECCER